MLTVEKCVIKLVSHYQNRVHCLSMSELVPKTRSVDTIKDFRKLFPFYQLNVSIPIPSWTPTRLPSHNRLDGWRRLGVQKIYGKLTPPPPHLFTNMLPKRKRVVTRILWVDNNYNIMAWTQSWFDGRRRLCHFSENVWMFRGTVANQPRHPRVAVHSLVTIWFMGVTGFVHIYLP